MQESGKRKDQGHFTRPYPLCPEVKREGLATRDYSTVFVLVTGLVCQWALSIRGLWRLVSVVGISKSIDLALSTAVVQVLSPSLSSLELERALLTELTS